jgi:hypothetical protein
MEPTMSRKTSESQLMVRFGALLIVVVLQAVLAAGLPAAWLGGGSIAAGIGAAGQMLDALQPALPALAAAAAARVSGKLSSTKELAVDVLLDS